MTGGPAQQETFDPKPDAFTDNRGPFLPTATNVPGIHYSELLPQMAKQAHRCAVIRSTWHGSDTHGVGVHLNLSGLPHTPRSGGEPQLSRLDPPGMSGVVRQLLGDRNGLPAAVQLPVRIGDQNNYQWAGQHAGMLGPKFDPLLLGNEKWLPGTMPPEFLPNPEVGLERVQDRLQLMRGLEGGRLQTGEFQAYDSHRDRALSTVNSQSAFAAFSLEKEKPELLEKYGNTRFGRSCLVARRLVEAGVSLVTVAWYPDPPVVFNSEANFDTHSKHFDKMQKLLLPTVDRAFAALLDDLADHGLLNDTIVAWTGEFGRTPKINKSAGRDHWGKVYSTVLAGGGIRGGQVYGETDRNGGEAIKDPVHTRDFIATIYHALGIREGAVVHDAGGRPIPIVKGKAVEKLFG